MAVTRAVAVLEIPRAFIGAVGDLPVEPAMRVPDAMVAPREAHVMGLPSVAMADVVPSTAVPKAQMVPLLRVPEAHVVAPG